VLLVIVAVFVSVENSLSVVVLYRFILSPLVCCLLSPLWSPLSAVCCLPCTPPWSLRKRRRGPLCVGQRARE
jgi:hypothetical protein